MHLIHDSFTTLLIVLVALIGCFVAGYLLLGWLGFPRLLVNSCIALASVLLSLLFLELFFSQYTQSDGFGFTLSSQKWFKENWKPINRFGFRDRDYSNEELEKCEHVIIVGDSFVTGHGIADVKDRFADKLRFLLGPHYCTMILADNGWGTRRQLTQLKTFPLPPNILVWSYFLNDIDEVISEVRGFRPENGLASPPKALAPLIENSYLFNFLFWRILRTKTLAGESYWDRLRQAYSDDLVWEHHKKDLSRLSDYAISGNIPTLIVVWPNLGDIQRSLPITQKVSNFFQVKGIATLNLGRLLADRAPEQLVVNPVDAHPNSALHAEVASAIATKLTLHHLLRP